MDTKIKREYLPQDGEGKPVQGLVYAANDGDRGDFNQGLSDFANGLLMPTAMREARTKALAARAANEAAKAKAGDTAAANAAAAAANDAGFSDTFYSEPLTNFLVGWKDPYATLEFLNSIAPQIPVGRRYEFKASDNDQAFLSESDDIRALEAEFKEVRYTQSTQLGQTKNKGLTIVIDRDRVAAFGPMYQERYTAWLTQRLFRNEIVRVVAGLSGGATASNKTWSSGSPDPDADVLSILDTAGDAAGLEPNLVFYGKGAWLKRALAVRGQLTAGSIASSQLKAGSASYTGKSAVLAPNSGAELADFLGVDEVIVARARYTSAASTKTKILNNTILMYFAEQGQMMDDPSNVKRFVSECEGGGYLRVYLQNTNAKFLKLTVEHYSDIVIPTTKGLYKSTII